MSEWVRFHCLLKQLLPHLFLSKNYNYTWQQFFSIMKHFRLKHIERFCVMELKGAESN